MSPEVEQKAKELAMMHGGKIRVVNREGAYTNAYLELTREGRWSWPRGLHTGDLLATYIEWHWKEFVSKAEAEIAAAGQGARD